MKFYEFNEYEYYALIGADNEENAKLGYIEVVADIEDNEKELTPNTICKEDALKRYVKAEVEGCKTVEDNIEDFNKQINSFNDYDSKGSEPYMVFLIDGSLY